MVKIVHQPMQAQEQVNVYCKITVFFQIPDRESI